MKKFLWPLCLMLVASCITINVQPARTPLTFDALEDSNRIVMPDSSRRGAPNKPRFQERPEIYLTRIIEEEAARAGIDPALLAAVIQHESGGDSLAVNKTDPAYGLGQVMPLWWETVFVQECGAPATPVSLLVARTNVCYTAHILALAHKRFQTTEAALSYYNTGSPHKGITNGYVRAVLTRTS